MQVAAGTVVDGRIAVPGLTLPEGLHVLVLVRGDDGMVVLDATREAALLAALDDIGDDSGLDAATFLSDLQRRFG